MTKQDLISGIALVYLLPLGIYGSFLGPIVPQLPAYSCAVKLKVRHNTPCVMSQLEAVPCTSQHQQYQFPERLRARTYGHSLSVQQLGSLAAHSISSDEQEH